jgi:hypothetical protein
MNSATTESKAQKSERTRLSGVAPDCPVQLKDKRPQRSTAQNPNGCADVASTGQCPVVVGGHRTVRCAHRQQPWPTATRWLGAINTSNHHNLWHPSFQKIAFNTRASAFTPRHISKDQTLSKCRIHLNHLVT